MATDYGESRKTHDEQQEESLEARRLTSGEQDKTSGKVDEDETELAVVPREVVDAVGWGEASDAGVGSVVIIDVEPVGIGR
jgi:Domain of unknown function (DUF4193)